MKCAACAHGYCVNCNNWQPVPEGPGRELLEAIFGPDVKECCCQQNGDDDG
jgi:hypothetical protein